MPTMKNSAMSRSLFESDPEVAAAIDHEAQRQHEGLVAHADEGELECRGHPVQDD